MAGSDFPTCEFGDWELPHFGLATPNFSLLTPFGSSGLVVGVGLAHIIYTAG